MRTRLFLIVTLLLSSLSFSGCFEIYYDIVENPDGTFLSRQTIALSDALIQGLASLAGGNPDSSAYYKRMIVDSVRHSLEFRRDSLVHSVLGTHGITSITIHDTTIDTMIYFTIESKVVSADSLSDAVHLIGNSTHTMESGIAANDSDDIRLLVKRSKEKTMLTFHAPQKEDGFMHIDMPGVKEMFKGLSLHYRVFSASLERPTDKLTKVIPGGQERVFGLNDLLKKGRKSHLDATFVIKNTGTAHN